MPLQPTVVFCGHLSPRGQKLVSAINDECGAVFAQTGQKLDFYLDVAPLIVILCHHIWPRMRTENRVALCMETGDFFRHLYQATQPPAGTA